MQDNVFPLVDNSTHYHANICLNSTHIVLARLSLIAISTYGIRGRGKVHHHGLTLTGIVIVIGELITYLIFSKALCYCSPQKKELSLTSFGNCLY